MKDKSFGKSVLVLILLSSGFIFYFYYPIIFHPNQLLFSSSGDGISSYYNSLYHIESDSSYLQFEGMNYPFGEHLSYSVNNPALTNIIKLIHSFFPEINQYTVGILNISMLMSFLLTAIFIFLILNELKINRYLAVVSSVSIMVLSPQIFRMQGHLSLAYSFFIPFSLWLFLQFYSKKEKLIWFILLFFNSLLWILVHPYYTAILASFYTSYAFFYLFVNHITIYKKLKFSLTIFVVALLPIVLYRLFIFYTDNHLCRTTKPYGFLVFTSNLQSIFIPHHAPFRPLLDKLFSIRSQEWEGWSYVGMANSMVILYFMLTFLFNRIRKESQKLNQAVFKNSFLNLTLLSSIVVVLFSMGLPFKIFPGYVPDFLNFFNEFRVPGRFAWIFYYAISIHAVFFVHHLLIDVSPKEKIRSYILISVFALMPIIESIPVHSQVSSEITKTPNYFVNDDSDYQVSDGIKKLDLKTFQAILPLPFYHRGSENFSKTPTDKILKLSELLSYKSGLPLMASFLARTSIDESKMLIQMIGPSQYPKPVKDYFKSKKPFLVICSKEKLSENEAEILKRARLVENLNEFDLYHLEFDSLFKKDSAIANISDEYLIYQDFENLASSISYRGDGALTGKLSDYTVIYNISPELIQTGKTIEISFWMYNCGVNCGQDMVNSIVYLDVQLISGKSEWKSVVNPAWSETINDCWSEVVLNYRLEHDEEKPAKIAVMLKGDDRLKQTFAIDEFRIKILPDSD